VNKSPRYDVATPSAYREYALTRSMLQAERSTFADVHWALALVSGRDPPVRGPFVSHHHL